MLDQAENLRRLANKDNSKKKAKIITITSGKGGVGKSNFVVNMGITLHKKGKKVLIFDADIGMGNDDVLMGVLPSYNVFDLLEGKDINEVVVEGPYGINLLPGGSGINYIENLEEEERLAFIEKLTSLDEYDYIFIDTGAGINKNVLAFIACSEETIVITTPEPTSLTDAYSLIKATDHFKLTNTANVIVNRAFSIKDGEETYNKLKRAVEKFLTIKVNYLGSISEDRKLVEGVRAQVPFTILHPKCDASKSIERISNKLIGNVSVENMGAEGLFKKLFSLFS
ncbi:MAG: MinD/ParA family protein [Clostridium paraputrificum]|uniref:MinD/ParA family protein n=1 Tax=Clostridium paraputrificum TaxID=29363 RepID=UPI0006C16C4A|nr:MinD/ParA family protein [Clostridium paraputrificum]MDY4721145.1 MinD/ParA family protein [Clostridium paraputrificum]CUN87280.1 flagellar biosynthesis protein FlhG [Clostridium paraputrificum]CUP90025.1 flagellar biosynthesis protein FlhG [Clostridium paraputrificum]